MNTINLTQEQYLSDFSHANFGKSEWPEMKPYTNEELEVVSYAHKDDTYYYRPRRNTSECKTVEELYDVCVSDDYQNGVIESHCDGVLFDIVKSKIIKFEGRKHQHIAMDLATLIQIRNVAVTTTDKIADTIDKNKKHLVRELKQLEEHGFIKVFTPCGRTSNVRTILFNPSLFWKGDYSIRNMVQNKALMTGEWELDNRKNTVTIH